jgi:predicted enzyme related to lactoylglutathione lyase
MKIKLCSVFVDDQEKALRFYTQVLGFVKKVDVPVGEARWLTVVSPDEPDGTQLVLEPKGIPEAQLYTEGLRKKGIPLTAFQVDDIQHEYERLVGLGVVFTMEPAKMGETAVAIFEDTCGNLIQIYQA